MSFVSIIIPVRNEEQFIAKVLNKLLEQDYPREKTEIIVVDGLSEDGTKALVQEFQARHSNIRLVSNPKLLRASALNIGIKNARGDIILRIDARTSVPSDYVSKCVKALVESGAANVGGMQKPIADSPAQQAIGIAMSHPFGVGNAQFRIGKKSGFVDTVYLGCFKKEIFEKVGLFDEDPDVISEDSDMNHRISKAGEKVYFDKDIVAYYSPRKGIKELFKLYMHYGRAKAVVFVKRKSLTSWRQVVPPFFVLSFFLLPILAIFHAFFLYVFLGMMGAYSLANGVVSGYLTIKNKKDILFFLRLLLIFPSMHYSWGLGFWQRLLQRI